MNHFFSGVWPLRLFRWSLFRFFSISSSVSPSVSFFSTSSSSSFLPSLLWFSWTCFVSFSSLSLVPPSCFSPFCQHLLLLFPQFNLFLVSSGSPLSFLFSVPYFCWYHFPLLLLHLFHFLLLLITFVPEFQNGSKCLIQRFYISLLCLLLLSSIFIVFLQKPFSCLFSLWKNCFISADKCR